MQDLVAYVQPAIMASLKGFGFAYDPPHKECKVFVGKLELVIQTVCNFLDRVIVAELRNGQYAKNELVSWANSDVRHAMFTALGSFRDKIVDQEMIDLSRSPIPCEVAVTNFPLFYDILEKQFDMRKEMFYGLPQSKRFQRKHASRRGCPWPLDGIMIEVRKKAA